jgi:hypothetical protein
MKTNLIYVIALFFLASCDLLGIGNKSDDSSSIGGTTDIPINTVGNTFANSLNIGAASLQGSIAITSVTAGEATINIKFPIPPDIANLQIIKPKYQDANGNLDIDARFKMTDKGILDYNNKDHEPLVLVKYDAKVGDKYTLKKSDGLTITREVVRKSTDDDFYWGGMLIKTIDVEQSSNIPGVSCITYITNHKFGLVAVQIEMEDGSFFQLNLIPSYY